MVLQRKIVIIGDGSSGKTSLILRFVEDRFSDLYVPTTWDESKVSMNVSRKIVELTIFDTAGADSEDWTFRLGTYKGANVILVAFSIDSLIGFENANPRWARKLDEYCKDAKRILVGLKKDLRFDVSTTIDSNDESTVTVEQGNQMAEKMNAIRYMECSSKTNEGVREVFEEAARISLREMKQIPEEKKCIVL